MWKEAEEFLLKDKYTAPLIKQFGHCKIKPRVHTDFFQELVEAIIGQQLSGNVAEVIFKRLKNKTKGRLTPGKIILLSDQTLRDCGMAWAKVKSIKDLAEKIINNKLKIIVLDKLSDDEAIRELIAVKGIGPWTADMFLMFTLGRQDVFPVGDLGIRKGFAKVVGKELNKDQMVKFSLRWKPYRTIASWYLWRVLD